MSYDIIMITQRIVCPVQHIEKIHDSFPVSIVRCESSMLAYRTFTIDPRLRSQIARFAFPCDTHIMQSHTAHNGDLSRGSRNQFLKLKRPLFAVIEVIVLLSRV